MATKIPVKIKAKSKRRHIKIRYLSVILVLILASFCMPIATSPAQAEECPDVKLLFARGSGEQYLTGKSFRALDQAMSKKMQNTGLSYQSEDISYPAVAIGMNSLEDVLVSLGALISAGEGFTFGESVATGVTQLIKEVNNECPNTRFVIGGYSQGAAVVHKAISRINSDKVLYIANFGDPKLYLPEGSGISPEACRGQNLSEYRSHVPDCRAYMGILGASIPYRPDYFAGRVGLWCNDHDIVCSSHYSIGDHSKYVANGLYEDASRTMFDRISKYYNLGSHSTSPHDTVFLIDSTGSMSSMIDRYKQEALRLAKETLAMEGGRVSLYDYRDIADGYRTIQHCTFETCTYEIFEQELNEITTSGGGDTPESLLSASLYAMTTLEWQVGATKSLVILTDAGYHSPDIDGTTFADVVDASKAIDPVNFYVITNPSVGRQYEELAQRTDGKVYTNFDELSLLTDFILDRYDSLPRVEESAEPLTLPTITIDEVERLDETTAKVRYSSDAPKAIVVLNDAILGITDQKELTISDLRPEYQNTITLVPLTEELRGDPVSATLIEGKDQVEALLEAELAGASSPSFNVADVDNTSTPASVTDDEKSDKKLPKVPNAGITRQQKLLRASAIPARFELALPKEH